MMGVSHFNPDAECLCNLERRGTLDEVLCDWGEVSSAPFLILP